MDFEALQNLIPKPSVTWTVNDIETWLDFIGLSAYSPQFSIYLSIQKQLLWTVAASRTSRKKICILN